MKTQLSKSGGSRASYTERSRLPRRRFMRGLGGISRHVSLKLSRRDPSTSLRFAQDDGEFLHEIQVGGMPEDNRRRYWKL
jgi:hypothetical protein